MADPKLLSLLKNLAEPFKAMELAPRVGLAERIVDLVSSGATLKANGLKEVETIMEISSSLIVNRTAYKTRRADIAALVSAFEGALSE